MLIAVKRFFGKAKQRPLIEWKNQFYKNILAHEAHKWIRENHSITRAFHILVSSFNKKAYSIIHGKENVQFCLCNGRLGAAFSDGTGCHVVLVYPDLFKMLKSGAFMTGISIMAHELGHVAFNHSGRNIRQLDAQVEADYFAFLLGFGEELQSFLLHYSHSLDIKVRIARLTSLMMTA